MYNNVSAVFAFIMSGIILFILCLYAILYVKTRKREYLLILTMLIFSVIYTVTDALGTITLIRGLSISHRIIIFYLLKSVWILLYTAFISSLFWKSPIGKFFSLTGLIITGIFLFYPNGTYSLTGTLSAGLILTFKTLPMVLKFIYFISAGFFIIRNSKNTNLQDYYRNSEKIPPIFGFFISMLILDDLLFVTISSSSGIGTNAHYLRIILTIVISVLFGAAAIKHTSWQRFTIEAENLFSTVTSRQIKIKNIFSHSDSVFWIIDVKHQRVDFINKAFEKIWERPVNKIYTSPNAWLESVHKQDREYLIKSCIEKTPDRELILEYRIIAGGGKWIREKVIPVKDSNGKTIKILKFSENVTDEVLSSGNFSDDKSLLPIISRKIYFQTIDKKIERYSAITIPSFFSLILFDINRFRDVNHNYGNYIGDKVLETVFFRINNILRKTDKIFRIGGDNFAIILGSITRENDVILVVEKIVKEFEQPFLVEAELIPLDIKMGVSLYPRDGKTSEELARKAELTLIKARNKKKNYIFYTEKINTEAVHRLTMIHKIREALSKDEFILHYQPIVNGAGVIRGIECLLRWNNPGDNTNIQTVIDIAENNNLILELGEMVFRKAFAALSGFKKNGVALFIAVNVSPIQILHPGFVNTILETSQNFRIEPSRIHIEITENIFMREREVCFERLNTLGDMGFHISMDDFGTGYSSLKYLKYMPFSTVKTDKFFLRNIPEDPSACSLLKATIDLISSTGKQIIVEGVENKEQLNILIENKDLLFQGYFFSKPVNFQQLIQLLEKESISIN